MKTQKLKLIVPLICSLLGTSGAAMARNDCPDGSLVGGTYATIVIDEFVSCEVLGALVLGKVLVTDANQFTMMSSLVKGDAQVSNSVAATFLDNHVSGGNLVLTGNRFSASVRNVVVGGDIRLIDDVTGGEFEQSQDVTVMQNLIYSGNLQVHGNNKAEVDENSVRGGDITCLKNDKLDSHDNDTLGGKTECSRNFFDNNND